MDKHDWLKHIAQDPDPIQGFDPGEEAWGEVQETLKRLDNSVALLMAWVRDDGIVEVRRWSEIESPETVDDREQIHAVAGGLLGAFVHTVMVPLLSAMEEKDFTSMPDALRQTLNDLWRAVLEDEVGSPGDEA